MISLHLREIPVLGQGEKLGDVTGKAFILGGDYDQENKRGNWKVDKDIKQD